MAHYARVENGIVKDVIVAEQEFIDNLVSDKAGSWIKTSYNTVAGVHVNGGTPLRKNFASVGYTYDKTRDAFIPPKQHASWTLNETTCRYEPPVAYPSGAANSNKVFVWDEDAYQADNTTGWVEVT